MEIEWHMLHPGYYLRSFVDGSGFFFFFPTTAGGVCCLESTARGVE